MVEVVLVFLFFYVALQCLSIDMTFVFVFSNLLNAPKLDDEAFFLKITPLNSSLPKSHVQPVSSQ